MRRRITIVEYRIIRRRIGLGRFFFFLITLSSAKNFRHPADEAWKFGYPCLFFYYYD